MKTVFDTFKEIYGERFKVETRADGKRIYRHWVAVSICIDGIVADVGKSWSNNFTLVSPDDMEILDVCSYAETDYESDHEAYARAKGIKTVEDLLGLPCGEFFDKLKERIDTS